MSQKNSSSFMNSYYFKAPQKVTKGVNQRQIFLAGTIDNGEAPNWQDNVAEKIISHYNNRVVVSPRRDDWNSSLNKNSENPEFFEQVNWELQQLEKSDFIIFVFLPDSKSPITLLELGMYINQRDRIMVYCPENFHASANIYITCRRYGVPVFKNLDTLLIYLNSKL